MSARRELEIEGRAVPVSNLDRVYWPDVGGKAATPATGITKADVIEYYRKVARVLLPHTRGRPMTLARFPEGVFAQGWYQLNCRGAPDWIRIAEVPSRSGAPLRMCVLEDEASLVWAVNQGTIELHPFEWSIDSAERPKVLLFDLAPGPPADAVACAAVALQLRAALRSVFLESHVKTSGRSGLHVYVPLDGGNSWGEVRDFARATARAFAAQYPEQVTDRISREARTGRVFIDWGQNHPLRSTIVAYSLRALALPGASVPLKWDELEQAVEAGDATGLMFGPADVFRRLARYGDLWAPVLSTRQALPPTSTKRGQATFPVGEK